MSILHHPEDDLLIAYAAGTSGEAIALIVATHLAFCGRCRRKVAEAERMGGALLDDLAPEALGADALARTLARLDAPAPAPVPPPLSRDGVPGPLLPYLKAGYAALPWRRLGASLAYLPLFRRDRTRVKLLKGVAGVDTGWHSHHGTEFTLVLQGGFTDTTGSYAPGDLQVAGSETFHNPVADPGEDCINLSVTTGPLKFKGLVPMIAGKLFGF